MKAKIAITVSALMFVLIPGLFAQTNLNNLMKRCETMSSVNMNVIMNRDKETREVTKVVKTVNISNDKRLVDDFLTAFSRDKDQADRVIENISGGKSVPSLYSFTAGDKQISYTFNRTDDANASVTYIERKAGSGSFMDMFSINNMPDMEAWGEGFSARMNEWRREFGPRMEEMGRRIKQNIERGNTDEAAYRTKQDSVNEERFFREQAPLE